MNLLTKIRKKADDLHWRITQPQISAEITRIRGSKLTFLSKKKMRILVREMDRVESEGIDGAVLEAGCALGGSAILLSKVKNPNRHMMVYDVFEMIPPPTAEDPEDVHLRYKTIVSREAEGFEGDEYYGYQENLFEKVVANFVESGVELEENEITLFKGLLQDTMNVKGPVSLAHIDVDWFDPVKVCLERIYPNLSLGGVIVLDDYFDWGGCRKAVDEFLAVNPGVRTESSGSSFRIYKA